MTIVFPPFGSRVTTSMGAALLLLLACSPAPEQRTSLVGSPDTIRVAVPTGEAEMDRSNVQAAFDSVQPGGTVLFAPGTYLMGRGAFLDTPDVTTLGHPDGTVLRGCAPAVFAEIGEVRAVVECTGLYVRTRDQTVRGLTFEYAWHGIVIGAYPATEEELEAVMESGELPPNIVAGGHRIEGNIFRASPNGMRVTGTEGDRTVVRDNDFVDVYHAIGFDGAPLHFVDNRVTVEDPRRIPNSGHQGSAIGVLANPGTGCAGHVVAGNTIEGYHDGITVVVFRGEVCEGVEIRDNAIRVRRVAAPRTWRGVDPEGADTTIVGNPISLRVMARFDRMGRPSEEGAAGRLADALIQENRIDGAEGVGIAVSGADRVRIVGNTIASIERRVPFPGNTWGPPPAWEAANGSAIWISEGSRGHEISGNVFDRVAGAAVHLEGRDSRVEVRTDADVVRDLGSGNRVTVGSGGR